MTADSRWRALYSDYANQLNDELRSAAAARLTEQSVPHGLSWTCDIGEVKIESSTVRPVCVRYIAGPSIERDERVYTLARSDGAKIEVSQTALLRRLSQHRILSSRPWWRLRDPVQCPDAASPIREA